MNFLMINSPLYRNPWEHYDEVLPPIWLGYICTDLKNKWFNVELFDAVAWKIPLDEIIDYIEHGNFSHVWLNIFSTNYRLVQEIVTRVSRDVVFLLWWAFTKSNAQDIVDWNTTNAINVVIWEGDIITSDIISSNLKEDPIHEKWNKRIFKVDKNSVYFPKNLSELNIDRTFFQYEPTMSVKSGKKEWNIIVSRWCVYDCAFCSAAVSLNKWTKTRIRTKESVRNEILQLQKLHPDIQSIRILDDLFLRSPKSILEAIDIFSWLNMEWRAMAHIQSFKKVDHDLLCKMKENWCSELSIWIESGNDAILRSINKVNTSEEVKSTIKAIFKAWISVKGYFIIWFPWETKKQFEETYNLARYLKESSLDHWVDFRMSVFQFRPYHWTQLYYDLIENGVTINDIKPNEDLWVKKIGEYDFSNWNFSEGNDQDIKLYIEKIRILNDISLRFIPFHQVIAEHQNNWVFFVWLSHKLWKTWDVLEAFCDSTNSWRITSDIVNTCPWISIYKTNLVKWVPLGNNRKIRYPDQMEKKIWLDLLKAEIDVSKPKMVFLFWKEVSDFILQNLEVRKLSECEYQYWDALLILAKHPSYIAVYKRKQMDNYILEIASKINWLWLS